MSCLASVIYCFNHAAKLQWCMKRRIYLAYKSVGSPWSRKALLVQMGSPWSRQALLVWWDPFGLGRLCWACSCTYRGLQVGSAALLILAGLAYRPEVPVVLGRARVASAGMT